MNGNKIFKFYDMQSQVFCRPLASQGVKRRKLVDRRASKGRKIRYDVQEKLVNFMAPEEAGSPTLASRLFGRLFGSTA